MPDDEVRSVSSTGGEKGVKGARFDLIPTGPLFKIAEHLGIGASKYSDRNWERGYEWSKSYASLQRHIVAWWGGEDNDPELGSSHLAAVAFHVLVLLEYLETHPEFDDRPTTVRRRLDAGLAGTEDEDDGDPDLSPGYDPSLPPGFLFLAPLAPYDPMRGWEDIGAISDADTPDAFKAPVDLEAKGDLTLDGVKIAAGLTGRPTVFETVDDDIMRRVYIPNPEFKATDEPGKFTITPRPAPERPISVGTPVIYLRNHLEDPIEGVIETCVGLPDAPEIDRPRYYVYGVRYDGYERQLVTGVTRDQLWLQA